MFSSSPSNESRVDSNPPMDIINPLHESTGRPTSMRRARAVTSSMISSVDEIMSVGRCDHSHYPFSSLLLSSLIFSRNLLYLLLYIYRPTGDLSSLVTRCNHSNCAFSYLIISSLRPRATTGNNIRDSIAIAAKSRRMSLSITPKNSNAAPMEVTITLHIFEYT